MGWVVPGRGLGSRVIRGDVGQKSIDLTRRVTRAVKPEDSARWKVVARVEKRILERATEWWRCCFERGADGSILHLALRSGEQRCRRDLVGRALLDRVWCVGGGLERKEARRGTTSRFYCCCDWRPSPSALTHTWDGACACRGAYPLAVGPTGNTERKRGEEERRGRGEGSGRGPGLPASPVYFIHSPYSHSLARTIADQASRHLSRPRVLSLPSALSPRRSLCLPFHRTPLSPVSLCLLSRWLLTGSFVLLAGRRGVPARPTRLAGLHSTSVSLPGRARLCVGYSLVPVLSWDRRASAPRGG